MFLGHFIKNASCLLFSQIVDNHACEGAAEDGADYERCTAEAEARVPEIKKSLGL